MGSAGRNLPRQPGNEVFSFLEFGQNAFPGMFPVPSLHLPGGLQSALQVLVLNQSAERTGEKTSATQPDRS
jgi:hypothetical protein